MEYIDQVQAWLDTEPAKRDLNTGALLMLQSNRNKILYQNVIRKNNFEKIEYEIIKYISAEEPRALDPIILKMEIQIAENEKTQPLESKGKRSDHDTLPSEIQSLFESNLEIYPHMRSLHEKLKIMNSEKISSERLPFLTELLQLDSQLRQNWNTYDTYNPIPDLPVETSHAASQISENAAAVPRVVIDSKRISANRKYLSDNKAKQAALIENGDDDKAAILLEKMQNRYWELISNGDTFAPEQIAELKALGLITE
jgi:hypothetical protein